MSNETGPVTSRFLFVRGNRIQKRPDFLKVYDKGTVYRGRLVHVFVMPTAPELPVRLGITATKKTGGSVVRNRCRRMVREAFRLMLPELKPGYDIVVNVMRASAAVKMPEVQAALQSALVKAGVVK